MHQTQAEILSGPKSYYLAPLDALRFFAFLAVFLHHLPAPTSSAVMTMIRDYGWAGVDLFFVISSFLFFYLLDAEHQKAGSISARNFYSAA